MVPVYKFAIRKDLADVTEFSFLPSRGSERASGYDVRAAFEDRKSITVQPGEYVKIPLGLRAFCPEGWWYEVRPRSSSFAKKNLHALYGVVDEDYEGQLIFVAQYLPEFEFETELDIVEPYYEVAGRTEAKTTLNGPNLTINFGDAVAQILPVKRVEMNVQSTSNEELDELYASRNGARGTGGFGSTGK
jgi:dUTPase